MLEHAPAGLDEIIHVFGSLDTPQFEAHYIEVFSLPYPLFYEGKKVTRARCHHLIVENFQQAFEEIKAAGLQEQVKNYSGIFNPRPIRGQPQHPSTHSWGIAIDLEAEKYPLGSNQRFPAQVVDIFGKAGFFYGGDFISRKDPMHFQFCTKY
ncbi:M15 family metallopeptidase [Undibacterium sp. Ji42W]|uniref:M15 family metallopeptidase n=1 Tax=Undibacterium sp. Ji42W TaxID=3413039 RepID=UPI003BF33FBE